MQTRKIILFSFLSLIAFEAVHAQQGTTKLGIQYNAGLPVGGFKNQLSETSLRGFKADVLYGISDKFSIGFGTGYQDFYQKNPRQLYKLTDGSDASAVLTHSIQTIPLLATGKYNFNPGSAIQPYAALGVGGNLVTFTEMLGEFGEGQARFGFAARPEAGVYVPFKKGGPSSFTLGATYNIMPFNNYGFSNLNHLGIQAGVNIPLRN